MTYNPDVHHRQSIRLQEYDYSQNGAYFVTICTWQRESLFGEIVDSKMRLNNLGEIVQEEWTKTPTIRADVWLEEYVIMPNHFHAVIFLSKNIGATDNNRATHRVAPTGPVSGSIGAIIGQFKSVVTKRINQFRDNPGCPVWQRNYYERVIRNEEELARAREYIVNNPMKWAFDKENPETQIHGFKII